MSKLILTRHGQSIWNAENRFTGWVDVDLSQKGIKEAEKSGELIKKLNLKIDISYTSFLKRAIKTLTTILKKNNLELKFNTAWQLNERHYGSLQGLNKLETSKKYGENQVHLSSKDAKIIKENLYSWGSKIHSAIDRKKFYPSGTRAQGRVILNILVHSSGRLVKTEIAKSSGAPLLDNAAITAVKRAQFPVAPEGLSKDQYRFQIPVKMSRN